MTAKYFKL